MRGSIVIVPVERPFFENPIINSPYLRPSCHWELDQTGQPTQKVLSARRRAEFFSPIPKARRGKKASRQQDLGLTDAAGLSNANQKYDSTIVNDLRGDVDAWRCLPDPSDWLVSPETQRLLAYWRNENSFTSVRPFFCQLEAVETLIWLTEVAPQRESWRRKYIEHLVKVNDEANPGLPRVALKLATGAGKTTVMAMVIAWQTLNAVRRPNSRFSRGFLIITPGLTIRDRLNVLKPNDTRNYYEHRDLVPKDMLPDMQRAVVVIENFHKFKRRERLTISKGGKRLLDGRDGHIETLETDGQMLQRMAGDLLGMKNILVLNDEAHHCYKEKPGGVSEEEELRPDEKEEAKANAEAARLWISGLETVKKKLGISRIVDLSATPFFLRGSGYEEGTLFHWTMSDFSLMDAIECGIVKLPRVPVDDNVTTSNAPIYRELWENIRKDMPKKGRGEEELDPNKLPTLLRSALDALYSHYSQTFELWKQSNQKVPPCFIVVCNNTSTSKLVYDYVSGYTRSSGGMEHDVRGKLPLFDNFDDNGNRLARPRTILVDSVQMEAGGDLDPAFRKVAAAEIEQFRTELKARGEHEKADNLAESDLLREVMNNVGRADSLGESVRCVVSVSMLTEGWDANTVTHVLGVRAFGTQLLCEQVIGRALRRLSYQTASDGLFPVEYADVLGIPFEFNATPVKALPQKPANLTNIRAVRDRAALEIRYPRVQGYRVEMPRTRLVATFSEDSRFVLRPEDVGPTDTRVEGIVGQGVNIGPSHLKDQRHSTIVFELVAHMLRTTWRDAVTENPGSQAFMELRRIANEWLKDYFHPLGGVQPAQILDPRFLTTASEKITAAITRGMLAQPEAESKPDIVAILDPFNPSGSTRHVNYNTTQTDLYEPSAGKSHINYVVLDSTWEAQFCRVAEQHPRVRCYVKNSANLGFRVPYLFHAANRVYLPDFILRVEDGHGEDDLLNLIVEVKGYRGEDARTKRETMETRWIPGVNRSEEHGRWAFAELSSIYTLESEFEQLVESYLHHAIDQAVAGNLFPVVGDKTSQHKL